MNKNLPEDDYVKWVSKVKRISGRLENSPSYRPRGSSGSKTWYVAHNGSNLQVASPMPISNQQPNLDADGDTKMGGVNALQVLQTAIMALNAGPNKIADNRPRAKWRSKDEFERPSNLGKCIRCQKTGHKYRSCPTYRPAIKSKIIASLKSRKKDTGKKGEDIETEAEELESDLSGED
ncbi:hypothetical protein K3495_g10571 [Podosphaera aphanis]|nr:hypothetical protein K3495_g10571 [Podosphaera aphanis]